MSARVLGLRHSKGMFGVVVAVSANWRFENFDSNGSNATKLSGGASRGTTTLLHSKGTPIVPVKRSNFANFLTFQTATVSLEASGSPAVTRTAANEPVKTLQYDFVVLGYGNAGRSAVETLRKECPSARVALIDPLRSSPSMKRLDHLPQTAVSFCPSSRTVQLSDPSVRLKYRHGILVATGSRGAPPPLSLFDSHALDRVLELRPTERVGNTTRPVLAPQTVRQLVLMAASQGANVGIMGSGWEAVELAVAASVAGSKSPVLIFGSAGPLCHVLPRYLSTEVAKRLCQQGIETLERSLVRYVASDSHGQTVPHLELHTARSYDMLDTQRTQVDLLVVAPFVAGPRGTAVLPTGNARANLASQNIEQLPLYQPWSQMASSKMNPSIVVCYADDGRIVVNSELSAASRVYAAGSVAKFPSSVTGHAHVAGEGNVDSALAGKFAALHMARDYLERTNSSQLEDATRSFAAESCPIWRSDVCSYLQGEGSQTDALASVGIQSLCVGQCDSERLSTHGFWWTNRRVLENTVLTSSGRKRTRRRKTSSLSEQRPVFGTGVVFYLDDQNKILGIMTWGLPFTTSPVVRHDSAPLNEAFLNSMKDLIGTYANVSELELDPGDLRQRSNLMAKSKEMVELALSRRLSRRDTTLNAQRLMVPSEKMPRPLYRYTAAKPPRITSIGILKRKDHSRLGELVGENLYVKDENSEVTRVVPTVEHGDPLMRLRLEQYRQETLEQARRENELRARPPKEEPLWLRRGEANKGISLQERMRETFLANMRKGRWSDGSEAVQQAPVPRVVQDAKETVTSWLKRSNEDAAEPERDALEEDET